MFGFLKSLGKIVGKVAPIAASFIPGVGPAVGAAIGAGGNLIGGGDIVKGALGGAAGGLVNSELLGGEGLQGVIGNPMGEGAGSNVFGGLEKKLGKAITSPGMLGTKEGKLDLGKTLMAGTAIANTQGQMKQNKQIDKYNKASMGVTNDLLSRLLSPGPGLGNNPSVMDYGKLPY